MKPIDVLETAIARGGHPSLISSRRYRRYEGRPGEIVEKLSAEQRATLSELRSDDISEGKLSRYAAWLGADCYGDSSYGDNARGLCRTTVEKMLLEFDRKVLKIASPRRMPRKTREIIEPWS